jgi:DNA-binding SARP family transcriptional activator
MPHPLHYLPDALLVVVTSWLGLSLLVRAPHDRGSRVFAWFCLHLVLYGLSNLLPQLTSSEEVARLLSRGQLITSTLASIVFLHFITVLTAPPPGTPPPWQRWIVAGFYAAGVLLGLYALLGPLPAPEQSAASWARWGDPRFPAGPLSWAWIGLRVLPLLVALALMMLAYRSAPRDAQERRLRRIFLFTSLVGVVGALAVVAAREMTLAPALPRAMILVAMLALAYGVLVHRALLPDRVARRTFFYSIIGSLVATAYVGVVLVLERFVGSWLEIDLPLVSALSVVVVIATLEPLREWVRRLLDQFFYRREFDYVRLVRSLGDDMVERGDLTDQLQAALSVICRALGVQMGAVVVARSSGLEVMARYGQAEPALTLDALNVPDDMLWVEPGEWEPWPQARLLLPLRQGGDRLGLLLLGPQYVEQPFSKSEHALLDYVHRYLTLVISHANARDLQQDVIVALAEQSQALRAQQDELTRQAERAARPEARSAPPADGLRVYALGPLHVERDGEQITRWGGSKAGTYQAEGLFAFLFDRRGKGLTKDEAAEVIWPDLEIDRADSAFHRTLAALRRTLEPGLKRGNQSQVILYHHERYWLEPAAVAWSDVDVFQAAAERGISLASQGQTEPALIDLEYAAKLYRGDYLDDCPFFGDSLYVEERRSDLRARGIDVLLALGAAYEAQQRTGEAASAYRRAQALSPEGCPPAAQALARLQATVE